MKQKDSSDISRVLILVHGDELESKKDQYIYSPEDSNYPDIVAKAIILGSKLDILKDYYGSMARRIINEVARTSRYAYVLPTHQYALPDYLIDIPENKMKVINGKIPDSAEESFSIADQIPILFEDIASNNPDKKKVELVVQGAYFEECITSVLQKAIDKNYASRVILDGTDLFLVNAETPDIESLINEKTYPFREEQVQFVSPVILPQYLQSKLQDKG